MKLNRMKKGFTLIQLMIALFTFSVILAASAPIITKVHKKMPYRASHGKYICYWDNNKLWEEYYNSRTRISKENVAACKFESPSKVVSYKVELIGGGAGGNYYKDIIDVQDTAKNGVFDLRSGFSGDYIKEPGDDVLRKIFNNLTLTYCAPTGNGSKGYKIIYYAYPILNTQCYATDASNFQRRITVFDEFIKNNYEENDMVIGKEITQKLRDKCIELAELKGFEGNNASIQVSPREKTLEGFAGTPNTYLQYDHTIKLKNTDKNIANKLMKEIQPIKAGQIKDGIFTATTLSKRYDYNFSRKVDFDTKFTNNVYQAPNGSGQSAFAAIKKSDTDYVTAKAIAEGGEGASIKLVDEKIIENEGLAPKEQIEGTVTECTNYEPKLNIKTKVNKRTYTYGTGGDAGDYKTYHFADLKTCNITVGKGGAAGNASKNEGSAGGYSYIECTEPKIYKTYAYGGSKKYTSYYLQGSETINLYDYLYKNGDLHTDLSGETYTTAKQKGEDSKYKANENEKFFTKFKNFPNDKKFGNGGDGNTITDSLLDGWGTIEYYLDNTKKYTDEKEMQYSSYTIEKQATTEAATDGESGAVIITW